MAIAMSLVIDDSRLRERIEVLGPEISLEVLRSAVSTALIDRLGVTWDERYGQLQCYRERDCNVPDKWVKNPKLGTWVSAQRMRQKEGTLSPAQKTRSARVTSDCLKVERFSSSNMLSHASR
jgi:helicase associated protein